MKWLERCLKSVVESSIPLDAYIVDNGSIDGSQQFIEAHYPQFTLYQSPTNSGFGAANNIGLRHAIEHNYDYVYLLNQDAWVDPDTINTLIKQQKLNREYGVLSPLQANAKKSKLDLTFAITCANNIDIFSDYVFNSVSKTYENYGVMAAHWLISRECLLKVGLFSPVFSHYGEDNNYADRARFHKFKVGIATDVLGVHDREYRDMPKSKEVYLLFIPFLTISSDINKPFFKSIFRAYIKTIYSAMSLSFKHRDICIFLKYLFKIYPIIKIYKDRKYNTIGNNER